MKKEPTWEPRKTTCATEEPFVTTVSCCLGILLGKLVVPSGAQRHAPVSMKQESLPNALPTLTSTIQHQTKQNVGFNQTTPSWREDAPRGSDRLGYSPLGHNQSAASIPNASSCLHGHLPMIAWLVGWLLGWLVGWWVGWWVGGLVGWWVGGLVGGWVGGWLGGWVDVSVGSLPFGLLLKPCMTQPVPKGHTRCLGSAGPKV